MASPEHAVLGGREKVMAATAQFALRLLDPKVCVKRAALVISETAADDTELLALPKVSLAGYPYWTEGGDAKFPQWIKGRVRLPQVRHVSLGRRDQNESCRRAAPTPTLVCVMDGWLMGSHNLQYSALASSGYRREAGIAIESLLQRGHEYGLYVCWFLYHRADREPNRLLTMYETQMLPIRRPSRAIALANSLADQSLTLDSRQDGPAIMAS